MSSGYFRFPRAPNRPFDSHHSPFTDHFGYLQRAHIHNAVIKNVKVTGTVSSTKHHASGLVGFTGHHAGNNSKNRIENCIVSTTVNGGEYAGGLIGHTLSADNTVEGCVFDGLIKGTTQLGAIRGWTDRASDNPGIKTKKRLPL